MTDKTRTSSRCAFWVGVALALASLGAQADKPDGVGGGKHKAGKAHHEEREHDRERRDGIVFVFSGEDRRIVSEYYGERAAKGKCPPGLAKKQNGCQPPGQAKKWQKGQPLARDIRYYELPWELRVRLPVPPPNHRYVRIAGDILLIAVGTSMVVDAIEDILR